MNYVDPNWCDLIWYKKFHNWVLFQVNTSGEENKGGVQPDEVVEVAKHIIEKCPNIEFQGLMTIGALAHSVAREPTVGPNPDFLTLLDCKK